MSSSSSSHSSRLSSPRIQSPLRYNKPSNSFVEKIKEFLHSNHYIFFTLVISLAPLFKLATLKVTIYCPISHSSSVCVQCPKHAICNFVEFECIENYTKFNKICIPSEEAYYYNELYNDIFNSFTTDNNIVLQQLEKEKLIKIIESNKRYSVDDNGDIHMILIPSLIYTIISSICLFSLLQCIRFIF
ncbi:hypothetical protein TVAG_302380 [Trichomonas vaginalis G3]|uniref:Uncharacterized protein n=1 Tax=Trichomonas vaginalis (strain ATCC PRA-98 / G3) TaxID=412133 RepID=A2EGR3_TRIV3|nr:hypothetical protein TVAGG3_0172920 [Trichomonas vaginalis G3]EAY08151.1 hypothetical protein TVAG_302380 [Trichomonas vaginalis G3]KAI5548718.1 hypothetical protein TVAGG3_0172920 [Trichomonas vaginalis G3]|eukprot:XP_001320374.1 hypothetical protein [Trichomonas vaginalis G3]